MVKQLRYLTIIFEPEIRAKQIPLFRGAIINKVGKELDLFHNHSENGYIYRYPLIQYKRIKKHPAIICLEKGIDEIRHLFENPDWRLKLGEEEIELSVKDLKVRKVNLNVWDRMFNYKIFNWLALNEKNYKIYKEIESMVDKLQFLEKILVSNIVLFAKEIGWELPKDRKVQVKITHFLKDKKTYFKGVPLIAFDLVFKTNVFLPNYIGLGKGVSFGYGKLAKLKD